ncbi:MAG: PQQ-binding-like beta-propeller repeat protein [Paracoccaceae bacterium]
MISIAPAFRRNSVFALIGFGFLAACAEPQVILPGKREAIRSAVQDDGSTETVAKPVNESRPISLPAQRSNASWPQSPGTPAYRTENAALGSALQRVWSAPIGEGDSRKFRITATPAVADGRIFTLDATSTVTATSTSGATIWTTDIKPARDTATDATGGGLAVEGGRVYVSLGYGEVAALDAATGAVIWAQQLDATGSGSPAISGDLLYLVAGDDTGWALKKDDGRIAWQIRGTSSISNVLGAPAPAISNSLAVFAFGSGDVVSVFRRGGLRRWDASVTGGRSGRSISKISDVTGAPVIKGNTVYVGNNSGRIVSLNLENGERNWTATDGAISPVWPTGNSVFSISDTNELVRLNAADGSRVWAVRLPDYVKEKPRKRTAVFAHYGPILAGSRLIVASNDGLLRSFDPTNGTMIGSAEIPGGATSAPVVAGGVLYVVGSNGQLHAFR